MIVRGPEKPQPVRRHELPEGTVATDELSLDVAHNVDGPFMWYAGRRDDGLPFNVRFDPVRVHSRTRSQSSCDCTSQHPRIPAPYPQLKISRNFLDNERWRESVWGRETPTSNWRLICNNTGLLERPPGTQWICVLHRSPRLPGAAAPEGTGTLAGTA